MDGEGTLVKRLSVVVLALICEKKSVMVKIRNLASQVVNHVAMFSQRVAH